MTLESDQLYVVDNLCWPFNFFKKFLASVILRHLSIMINAIPWNSRIYFFTVNLLKVYCRLNYFYHKQKNATVILLKYILVVWFTHFTFIISFFRRKFLTVWTLELVVTWKIKSVYFQYHNTCGHQT